MSEEGDLSIVTFCAILEEHTVVGWGRDEMAGIGDGSFDRQEDGICDLQEVVYSGGEAAGEPTGVGGVAGGYQPGQGGNLHKRFANKLGLGKEDLPSMQKGGPKKSSASGTSPEILN